MAAVYAVKTNSRPEAYSNLDYLSYFEKVHLYLARPTLLANGHGKEITLLPTKVSHLSMYVIQRTEDDDSSVYAYERNFNGQQYGTRCEMLIASRLLADRTGFDIAFRKAVQIYSTLAELRFLVFTSYEQVADQNWDVDN